ncbi:T9SS type A sorting domain-containing protein [Paracrocinitomix mangrovi]|uniref:T9SS type A sorting domain-containing protein n=1 Tax=Paracrocinitomix mangrovi TaxID=2862509 RepID=UPI001C8EF99F|nr:T9SS type A sorting domain-containing protein [Paracrocinitomix mangrovi]UKN00283.1 T9SS type A sorting domain-containing protein [Paracrocinitomix mangrovi]
MSDAQYSGDSFNQTLSSAGLFDCFLIKTDENGQMLWANSYGSNQTDSGYAIDVDDNGNITLTGIFKNTVDFDLGTGVHELSSNGAFDVFVITLNSDGLLSWSHHIGGANSEIVNNLKIYGQDMYMVGSFSGQSNFNILGAGHIKNSNGTRDGYILKLDFSSVGFHPNTSSEFTLYPNPVNSYLNITKSPDTIQHIVVLNSIGQKVLESSSFPIDISHLAEGTYNVRILSNHQTFSYSIIKF